MGGALVADRGFWIPPGPLIRQGGGNPGGAPDRHACAGGLLFERHTQLASNVSNSIHDLPKLLRLRPFLLLLQGLTKSPWPIHWRLLRVTIGQITLDLS